MRDDLIREFVRCSRQNRCQFQDDVLGLMPREYYGYSKRIRCDHTLVFDVVTLPQAEIAGEIALRLGDSPEQFYLGHIGYHIDPPYRGHGHAARACGLAVAVFRSFGIGYAVITTDPGNRASIQTCLNLGCELESTVSVPSYVKEKVEISDEKHRFIWTVPKV
jgi:predicted acetyltransferase